MHKNIGAKQWTPGYPLLSTGKIPSAMELMSTKITNEYVDKAADLLHATSDQVALIRRWLQHAYVMYLCNRSTRSKPTAGDIRDRLANLHKLASYLAEELKVIDFVTASVLSERTDMTGYGKRHELTDLAGVLDDLARDSDRAKARFSGGRGGRPRETDFREFSISIAKLYTTVTGKRPTWSYAGNGLGDFLDFVEHAISILDDPPSGSALCVRLKRIGSGLPKPVGPNCSYGPSKK